MLAFIAIWSFIVAATTLVMARLGHSWFTWAVLSAGLGPLSWPLAADAVLADRRRRPEAHPHPGDVLVGVAPWAHSAQPILRALAELGDGVRGVTLVRVLDAEDAATPAGRTVAREAEAELLSLARDVEASGLVEGPVDRQLAFGRPADELGRLARAGGYGTILLGPSGPRSHHVVHGHTGSRLRRRASIPVLKGTSTETGL